MKIILTALFSIALIAIYMHLEVPKATSVIFQDISKPDLHFEIIDEIITSDVYPMSSAKILIGRNDYTKANLEALFKWYSAMHSRKGELLKVLVFTSKDNLLADKQITEIEFYKKFDPNFKHDKPMANLRDGPLFDAFFRKEVRHSDDIEEINELYSYIPDLDRPDVSSTVIIKGRNPWP